jgi:uncharacterized protein (DUF983 family)
MADHAQAEYATAEGNDLPAHEAMYDRFVHLIAVGGAHVVNMVLGLAVGALTGHWFAALCIFILAVIQLVAGLLSGSRTPSYVGFVLCGLIFLYAVLG